MLASLTEFFGMIPKLPNEILGIDEPEDISFQAKYNRLGSMLLELDYRREDWMQAGRLF